MRVRDLGLTALYSSPLLRAFQTANKIAQQSPIALPITIMQDLTECSFGEAEGLTFDQVRQKYGSLIDEIFMPTYENWHKHFPSAESKQQAFMRFKRVLDEIVQKPDTKIGIVCHAGIISALRCGLNLRTQANYDNCSVLHLQYDADCGYVEI